MAQEASNAKVDSARAWFMLGVVFLFSLAAPLNQFKVPPMTQQLAADLGIGLGTAGWLMSVFCVVSIFLSLPAGFIIGALGLRGTGLLAMGSMIAGSMIGGLATSAEVLLLSRVIEGVGMCFISVLAPAAIAPWFSDEKRGTAMGLWGIWVPLGLVIMFNAAPLLGPSDWRPVWWFATLYSAGVLLLFILVYRLPGGARAHRPAGAPVAGSFGRKLRTRDIWLLGAAFLTMNVTQIMINTFMPTFLETVRGLAGAKASFITSLFMLTSIAACALGGVVSDRLGSRKLIIAWPLLGLAVLMLLPFSIPTGMVAALMVGLGLLAGPIPAGVFAAAPEIMGDPRDAGIGLSVVALGQNLGMFLGAGFYGMCIEQWGWDAAGYMVIPVLLAGFGAALAMRIR